MGLTREEAELRAKLVRDIVIPEVLQPMDAHGWRQGAPAPAQRNTLPAGQPGSEGAPGNAVAPAATTQGGQPAPNVGGQPAPAGTTKADSPDMAALIASFEALRDPDTGLIAKKYPTVEAAIKGQFHLTHMAKDALAEADALRKRLAEVERLGSNRQTPVAATPAATAPQPSPSLAASQAAVDAAQARYDKVLSDIAENGGVLDAEASKALSKANRELTEAAANKRVEEQFASRDQQTNARDAEWKAVDDYMNERHPAASRFSEEVAVFVDSNPMVKRAVQALLAQGDKVGATEFAWTSFEGIHGAQVAAADHAKAEAKEADLAAREQVRQEAVATARKDASVVTGSAGGAGVHENRSAAPTREMIAAATERMRREGEAPGSPGAELFRRMVIGPSLGFLNGQ